MRKAHAIASGITPVLLLLLFAIPGKTVAQQSAAAPQTHTPPEVAVVPVAEVVTQATEVSNLLRTLSTKLAPSPEIDTIHKMLPEVSGTLDLEIAATINSLQKQPSLALLQTQQQLWQRRQLQTTGWLHVLTGQATHLQDISTRLAELLQTWTATRAAAQLAQAPEPILQQIDATLAARRHRRLSAQRTVGLDLQRRGARGGAVRVCWRRLPSCSSRRQPAC
jgi:hypothetical protein